MNLRRPNKLTVCGLIAALSCLAMGGGNLSAVSLTAYRTHWTRGFYLAPGSFDEHLWTNWEARAVGREARLLSDIRYVDGATGTNAVWNTNWYFYGLDNFTAQTHIRTNSGESYWKKKSTILSRLVIINAGHNMAGPGVDVTNTGVGQWYLAVDATNGQHWRQSVASFSRNAGNENDYAVSAMDSPWPTNIATMKLLRVEDFTNKISGNPPAFFSSQFSRTESSSGTFIGGSWLANATNGYYGYTNLTLVYPNGLGTGLPFTGNGVSVTNSFGGAVGGDSGSPTFIVVSNRLVFLSGRGQTSPTFGTNLAMFLQDVNAITTAAGYTTNDYPVEFETLSQFPDL